jgi:hypothetical protein
MMFFVDHSIDTFLHNNLGYPSKVNPKVSIMAPHTISFMRSELLCILPGLGKSWQPGGSEGQKEKRH